MSIKVTPVRRSVRPNVYITTNTDALIGSSNDTPKRLMLIGMAMVEVARWSDIRNKHSGTSKTSF